MAAFVVECDNNGVRFEIWSCPPADEMASDAARYLRHCTENETREGVTYSMRFDTVAEPTQLTVYGQPASPPEGEEKIDLDAQPHEPLTYRYGHDAGIPF